MKLYKKAILPKGFKANGVSSGIKKSGKLDLALFYSVVPARASCKFTSNKFQAAPVKLCKQYLQKKSYFSAVLANSGNANCYTGQIGLRDAEKSAVLAADRLSLRKESVLVASTGIIGRRLAVDKIRKAIPGLVDGLSVSGIHKAEKAILTTDTVPKEVTVKFNAGGRAISICGVAKGSGMIAPNFATMLCFIFTDACISKKALDKALDLAVGESFNCITIDNCMSTNDSVMLLANGLAGNKQINSGKELSVFTRALKTVCVELAKLLVRDAEGASKFIEINVRSAKSPYDARNGALAIANSDLFKTAVYGENPNFGRIIAAIGSSGIDCDEKKIKVRVSSLKKHDVHIDVWLGRGKSCATVYTSDLTPEYIKINAAYN